jgi:hypothetical protein
MLLGSYSHLKEQEVLANMVLNSLFERLVSSRSCFVIFIQVRSTQPSVFAFVGTEKSESDGWTLLSKVMGLGTWKGDGKLRD